MVYIEKLVFEINKLKKDKITETVKKRILEFENIGKDKDKIFEELCFCLLTANFRADKSIFIQNILRDKFHVESEKRIAEKLRELGHRFPEARAKYIVEARTKKNLIYSIIRNSTDEKEKRERLVKEIKGLGYKEASHFLRNIGYKNLAIIDFHILNLLEKFKVIKKPKTLTKKRYLEIENILKKIADKTNNTLAELDLYLWYLETGEVLK
ncbi:MAG: N-glycosylase/DNA lyase [Candidatus Diapherotrites archaeon]|nr:N-glycosylase/DNA lyase [Candidatus Diapherotrites archaeon]